jgi:uncharacterized protein YraI
MSLSRKAALAAAMLTLAGAAVPDDASASTAAFSVTNVNMRAGPSTSYPVVVTLPPAAGLTLFGCTANVSWCDVAWGRDRGWVAANYLHISHQGQKVVVTPALAPAIGITVVAFNRTYWNTHYVGRPWYGHWHGHPPHHSHPPHNPPRRAVGGCNDNGCAGASVRPGRVAAGHCSDGTCSGTSVNRGPHGRVWVRHGSISRD